MREGQFIISDGKSKKSRYVFLFNDILLATKKELEKFQLKFKLELGSCVVGDSQQPLSFVLSCEAKSYELHFKSEQEKNAWFAGTNVAEPPDNSDISFYVQKLQKRKLLVSSHKEAHPIFE